MTPRNAVYLALLLVAGLIVALMFIVGGQARQQLVYVACADKRVYAVDLASGEVVGRSNPIEGMGEPTSAAYVAETSLLYIGSQWDGVGQEPIYYPLVAVDVDDGFDVVGRYTLDPEQDAIEPRTLMDAYPVYVVVASPTFEHLYLMYASPDYGGDVIFDTKAERIVGKAGTIITPSMVFSPDGSQRAEIWPSSSRTVDGVTTEFPGGVAVRNIMTGELVSRVELEDNRGLQPPWGRLSSPLLRRVPVRNIHNLYDRDSGKIIASLNVVEITGMRSSSSIPAAADAAEPVLIEGTTRIVIPTGLVTPGEGPPGTWMRQGLAQGFLMVYDYATDEILKTIEIGPYPTNVVFREQS